MRKLLTFLLVFAFLIQSTGGLHILISFHLNRAYIAKNLCKNRFDALPVCKGQCYLNKQLAEQKKQGNNKQNLKLKEIQLFCQEVVVETLVFAFFSILSKSHFLYTLCLSFDYIFGVDQPPEYA